MCPLRYRSYRRRIYLGGSRDRPRPRPLNAGSTSEDDHWPRRRSTSPSLTPIILLTTRRRFDFCASSRLSLLLAVDVALLRQVTFVNRTSKKTYLMTARIVQDSRLRTTDDYQFEKSWLSVRPSVNHERTNHYLATQHVWWHPYNTVQAFITQYEDITSS